MIRQKAVIMPINIEYLACIEMIDREQQVKVDHIEKVVADLIENAQNDETFQLNNEGVSSYDSSIFSKLKKLANYFSDDKMQFEGTNDSFHNLSVDYAKQGLFFEACQILERGLSLRPSNVDLLADFLLYGKNIPAKRNKCNEYWAKLDSISRSSWTWRAYSFSIEHVLEERYYATTVEEEHELKKQALGIVNEYIEKYSKENSDQKELDKAISDKIRIYEAFGIPGDLYGILKRYTEKYKNIPLTLMRFAEKVFSSGQYSAAADYLSRCIVATLDIEPPVDMGYVRIFRAYSNTARLLSESTLTPEEKNDLVKLAYEDLDTAEELVQNDIYKKAISTLRIILEKQNYDNSAITEEVW